MEVERWNYCQQRYGRQKGIFFEGECIMNIWFKKCWSWDFIRNISQVFGLAVGQMSLEFKRNVWSGEIDLGGDAIEMIFKALRADEATKEGSDGCRRGRNRTEPWTLPTTNAVGSDQTTHLSRLHCSGSGSTRHEDPGVPVFPLYRKPLDIFLRFRKFGVESEILDSQGWCWCCWSSDHTCNSKNIDQDSHVAGHQPHRKGLWNKQFLGLVPNTLRRWFCGEARALWKKQHKQSWCSASWEPLRLGIENAQKGVLNPHLKDFFLFLSEGKWSSYIVNYEMWCWDIHVVLSTMGHSQVEDLGSGL